MKKNPIKIIYGKLGQYKSDGLAFTEDRVIMIDSRLRGQRELETIIHEIIHCQNTKWPEIMVAGKAKEMAQILWDLHYRKVDN